MNIRNSMVKYFGYFGVFIITLINGYFISFLGTSVVFSIVCSVWSFFEPLPAYISGNYGKLLLLASIPVGVILAVYIMVKAIPALTIRSKKNNKQDNGNH